MEIRKRDVQLFFKRLRFSLDNISSVPIKYYAVGEYGGKTMRPHYHIILFNYPPQLMKPLGLCKKGFPKFQCDIIANAWQQGGIDVGTVTAASVGYTMKYISKPSKVPMHRNDDRTREFSLMSKGLGASYLTPQMEKWHKADMLNRMYCNIPDGKKIAMPRYYKDKLYTEMQRKRIAFFQLQEMIKKQNEEMEKQGDDYWNNKLQVDRAAFVKAGHQFKETKFTL